MKNAIAIGMFAVLAFGLVGTADAVICKDCQWGGDYGDYCVGSNTWAWRICIEGYGRCDDDGNCVTTCRTYNICVGQA